jgi:hypothetical protein
MLAFLLAHANLPYTIALALMLALGLFELLAMLLGLSLLSALDDLLPREFEAGTDMAPGGITGLLGWLCLDRLPLLIWCVLALCSFAITGYSANFLGLNLIDAPLPRLLSVPLALVFTAISCRVLGSRLADAMPKNETSAISVDSLAGCVATVTLGRAVKGRPTEAQVRDSFEQKHYVLVEPEQEGVEFSVGQRVVLLSRKGRVWLGARLTD